MNNQAIVKETKSNVAAIHATMVAACSHIGGEECRKYKDCKECLSRALDAAGFTLPKINGYTTECDNILKKCSRPALIERIRSLEAILTRQAQEDRDGAK